MSVLSQIEAIETKVLAKHIMIIDFFHKMRTNKLGICRIGDPPIAQDYDQTSITDLQNSG